MKKIIIAVCIILGMNTWASCTNIFNNAVQMNSTLTVSGDSTLGGIKGTHSGNNIFSGNNDFTGVNTFEGYTKIGSTLTVSNEIVTNDIYTVAWNDYGSSVQLVGFTGTPTKVMYYKRIGNLCFITFKIFGTSTGATTEITFPYNAKNETYSPLSYTSNNGAIETNGWVLLLAGTNEARCIRTGTNGDNWTGTGIRSVYGQFFYEVQ